MSKIFSWMHVYHENTLHENLRCREIREELERRCSMHGYHIYQTIWDTVVGETLECRRQPLNEHNRYALAVIKDDMIIGYLPRKVSRLCSLFLGRGGCIMCTITGRKHYSADLPQGGLEVPCVLLFRAPSKEIQKLKSFMK